MRLLTVADVAEMLNISKARAYELIRHQLIPAIRIGRQLRVHPAQLEEWMAEGGRSLDRGRAGSAEA